MNSAEIKQIVQEFPLWVIVGYQNLLQNPGSALVFVTKVNVRIPQDEYYLIRPCQNQRCIFCQNHQGCPSPLSQNHQGCPSPLSQNHQGCPSPLSVTLTGALLVSYHKYFHGRPLLIIWVDDVDYKLGRLLSQIYANYLIVSNYWISAIFGQSR